MHLYHLKPWEVEQLTPEQYHGLLANAAEIEYRRHYSVASIEAYFRNRDGGKPDPNAKDAKKTIPVERLWTPDELLPAFAQPEALATRGWTRAAAADALAHSKAVPAWAVDLIPWEDLRALSA